MDPQWSKDITKIGNSKCAVVLDSFVQAQQLFQALTKRLKGDEKQLVDNHVQTAGLALEVCLGEQFCKEEYIAYSKVMTKFESRQDVDDLNEAEKAQIRACVHNMGTCLHKQFPGMYGPNKQD